MLKKRGLYPAASKCISIDQSDFHKVIRFALCYSMKASLLDFFWVFRIPIDPGFTVSTERGERGS